MDSELITEVKNIYREGFIHFQPIPKLGGRLGLDTDLIADSLGIKNASLVSKMKNTDFIEAVMKPYIESKDAVRIKGVRGSYWVFTEDAALALVEKYGTQQGLNLLYAKFLRDPEERKKAEDSRALEEKIKEENLKEKKEMMAPPPQDETTFSAPGYRNLLLRLNECEERVVLLEAWKNGVEQRLVNLPIYAYKSIMEEFKEAYIEKSWTITREIGSAKYLYLKKKNAWGPVGRRILEHCSKVLGKDCARYAWSGRPISALNDLYMALESYKMPSTEEQEKICEEIRRLPEKPMNDIQPHESSSAPHRLRS